MRSHHYHFSHDLLAQQVHRDAAKVLSELEGPLAEGFLFHLWQQCGQQSADQVPAVGLRVLGIDERGGLQYAILEMPEALHAGESLFAAILHREGDTRYYVFDRAQSADQATLARLDANGARINLGLHAATAEVLLAALVAEADGAPATPVAAPTPPAA